MDFSLPSFYTQPRLPATFSAAAPPPSLQQPPPGSAPSPPPAQTSSGTPPPYNHVADAANAAAPPSQSLSHPPYAEMIYAAITALKESDGSSKRAIAKYIEESYAGLPPTHSALLTHHLKRLKSNGLLVMIKKSYKLPGSDDGTTINTSPSSAITAQLQPSPSSTAAFPAPPPTASKRGRGRPPKAKPEGVSLVNEHPNASPQPVSAHPDAEITAAQPVLVSLGLAEDPAASMAKRSRGRPKKTPGAVGQMIVLKRGRGRPPTAGAGGPKRSPGRPRKPKSLGGIKTGRPGRPPKVAIPQLVTAPGVSAAPAAVAVFASPKPRGRPKKIPTQAAAGIVIGGPPKFAEAMTPRKSTGRPVGRPRKNANESWGTQSQMPIEVHRDLKSKLEFFQSRVREAVGVLKPHLTGAAISAVVAIQELEGLASMDLNTPLAMEPQQQAQGEAESYLQPQLQPHPQPQLQPHPQPHLQHN